MLIFIRVVVVFADGFSVAFTGEVDPFSETYIFQITGPAAGRLYIQNKTVVFCTIRAFAGHTEVCDEFAGPPGGPSNDEPDPKSIPGPGTELLRRFRYRSLAAQLFERDRRSS